jgi:hypothetical protein
MLEIPTYKPGTIPLYVANPPGEKSDYVSAATETTGVDDLAPIEYLENEALPAHLQELVSTLNESGFCMRMLALPETIMSELDLDDLPRGVGVEGGAARAMLQRVAFDEFAIIRDIDLVAIDGLVDGDMDLHALSEDYMADDYAYGYGVSRIDIVNYFATRDFSMNEVLVIDGVILATEQAVNDLRDKIIRPTEYESQGWDSGLGPKLTMKALLMQSVFERQYGYARCEGFDTGIGVSSFYVALALNKAFQYGIEVTLSFLNKIGEHAKASGDVVAIARGLMEDSDFEFRGSDFADRIMGYYTPREQVESDNMFDDGLPIAADVPYQYAIRLMGRYAGAIPESENVNNYR